MQAFTPYRLDTPEIDIDQIFSGEKQRLRYEHDKIKMFLITSTKKSSVTTNDRLPVLESKTFISRDYKKDNNKNNRTRDVPTHEFRKMFHSPEKRCSEDRASTQRFRDDDYAKLKKLISIYDSLSPKTSPFGVSEANISYTRPRTVGAFTSINNIDKYVEQMQDMDHIRGICDSKVISLLESNIQGRQLNFKSKSVAAEVILSDLLHHEKVSNGNPTKLKAAVCSSLLLQLCRSMSSSVTTFELLVHELLTCIFIGYNKDEMSRCSILGKDLYKLTSYFEELDLVEERERELNEEIHFIKQGTNIKQFLDKLSNTMFLLSKAPRYLRDCCFRLWKNFTMSRKKLRERVRKSLLKSYWSRWCIYITLRTGNMAINVKNLRVGRGFLKALIQSVHKSRAIEDSNLHDTDNIEEELDEFRSRLSSQSQSNLNDIHLEQSQLLA